jgi:hypothetical protein
MKMRTIVAGGLAAAALIACSSAPPAGVYVKPGVSEEQRARDQAECAAMAAASDNVRSVTLTAAERESIDACMRARGYTLVAQRR